MTLSFEPKRKRLYQPFTEPRQSQPESERHAASTIFTSNLAKLNDVDLAEMIAGINRDAEMIEAQLAADTSGEWPRPESWRHAALSALVYKKANLKLAQAEQSRRRGVSEAQAFMLAAGEVLPAEQFAAVWARAKWLFPEIESGADA